MCLEMVRYVSRCTLACPVCEGLVKVILVLQTTGNGQETFMHSPVWPAERLTQALPLGIVSYCNGDPRVLASARIDVMWRHAGMMIAHRAGVTLVHLRVEEKLSQVGQHIFGLRKFNKLSLACTVTIVQSCEQCKSCPRSTGCVHMYD